MTSAADRPTSGYTRRAVNGEWDQGSLLDRPEWHADAACADADRDLFFVGIGEPASAAKAICAVCPVRPECLEAALAVNEHHGIWGGMTFKERAAEKRRRRGLQVSR